jgi:hypothetical protein
MPLFIYMWNANSEGGNLLKEALGIRRIRAERSVFKAGANKTVINWGSSEIQNPEVRRCRILNPPDQVHTTSNKLSFFRKISETNRDLLPPWTGDQRQAIAWTAEGHVVCARTVLNGHSAAGLVLMDRDHPESFVRASLYTKYIKKDEEYRVHVVNGNVIAIQRKVLRREKAESGEAVNWKIRNLDNGFVYQREGINPHVSVSRSALEAIRLSGLDFGAVDVIYNRRSERSYVLEINSAPGITGTTVTDYATAFRGYQ